MVMFRPVLLFSLWALQCFAQDPSLLDNSLYCDAACKKVALDAAAWERSQHAAEPLDSFYTAAKLSPDTKPGDVLHVEQNTNLTTYTVPSGLTMSRILYASEELNGTTTLASTFVLWPFEAYNYTQKYDHDADTKPKFPFIAWAHGTSGLFPRCAPSNYKALQYHFITSFPAALEGFAIIAPDYAGLGASANPNGSKHPHQYLAAPAAANDLAFAIEAARKAFPDRLTEDGPYVAMGHSQGGTTSWAYAERQAVKPVPGYRGTITISPSEDRLSGIKAQIQQAIAGAPVPVSSFGFLPLVSAAVTAVYPSFNYSGFSDRVWDRWNNVIATLELCLPSSLLMLAQSVDVKDYTVNPNWLDAPEVKAWNERTTTAGRPIAGPLSIILGGKDRTTPEAAIAAMDKTCAVPENAGQHIEYLELGDMGHFPVISASRARWLQWIKDRVSDKPYNKECGKKTIVPGFNTNYTSNVGAFPPNWLVTGVSKQDQWKLAL